VKDVKDVNGITNDAITIKKRTKSNTNTKKEQISIDYS